MPSIRSTIRLALALVAASSVVWSTADRAGSEQFSPPAGPLPQTTALDWPEEDLSGRMMDGAHRFVERQIADSQARSGRFWKYDRSSTAAWNASVEDNRDRLREIIGVVDARLPPGLERFGDDENPALVAETSRYRVYQVRWPVLDGVSAEGLLVQPANGTPAAHIVVVPDAGQTPEQILGLAPGLPPERQFARRPRRERLRTAHPRTGPAGTDPDQRRAAPAEPADLARMAVPAGVPHGPPHRLATKSRRCSRRWTAFARAAATAAKVGVVGYAEGGLVAFYAAAIDPAHRRRARERLFRSARARLGGADRSQRLEPARAVRRCRDRLARAAAPSRRRARRGSVVHEQQGRAGRRRPARRCAAEFGRIPAVAGVPDTVARDWPRRSARRTAVHGGARRFREAPGLQPDAGHPDATGGRSPPPLRCRPHATTAPCARSSGTSRGWCARRSTSAIRGFLLTVLPELTALRWSTEKTRPTLPAAKFIEGARPYRERFRRDGVGVFDAPYLPLNPRTPQGRRDGAMDGVGRRARRLARCVRVGRAGGAEGSRAGRAAAGRRRAARAQRPAARHDRSPSTRPTTTSARRWPTADSSSSRRTTSIAARTAIAGSIARPTRYGPRSSRSSSASTSASSTGSDRCRSWTPSASRSTA